MKTYSPSEMAKLFGVHPNTIRFYEQIGYIAKAKRKENHYREFTDKQVLQLRISRSVMAYPFTNQTIRNTGKEIMKAAIEDNIEKAKSCADTYLSRIDQEIALAKQTAQELQSWADTKKPTDHQIHQEVKDSFSRKEIAQWLGVTTEAVRNWQRNGLIEANGVGANHETLFLKAEKERIRVIYMLRQSGYSMSAIYRSMSMYDEGKRNKMLSALHRPEVEEILSAGDNWLETLETVRKAAEEIPHLIEALGQLK